MRKYLKALRTFVDEFQDMMELAHTGRRPVRPAQTPTSGQEKRRSPEAPR